MLKFASSILLIYNYNNSFSNNLTKPKYSFKLINYSHKIREYIKFII
jgi:hypothetical protein